MGRLGSVPGLPPRAPSRSSRSSRPSALGRPSPLRVPSGRHASRQQPSMLRRRHSCSCCNNSSRMAAVPHPPRCLCNRRLCLLRLQHRRRPGKLVGHSPHRSLLALTTIRPLLLLRQSLEPAPAMLLLLLLLGVGVRRAPLIGAARRSLPKASNRLPGRPSSLQTLLARRGRRAVWEPRPLRQALGSSPRLPSRL